MGKHENRHEKNESTFCTKDLVANLPGVGRNLDINLVNAWGIVNYDDSLWITSNNTGLILNYNYQGETVSHPIVVPGINTNIGTPTGIIKNTSSGFVISSGINSASSLFLIATDNGTVAGYNALVDENNAITKIDNSANSAVYKGLAVADDKLFVADFYNNRIDVFDFNFNPVIGLPFVDGDLSDPLPSNFAPFNIVYLRGYLFVLYASQNFPGTGYINIFDTNGVFIKRFASGSPLNAPQSLIVAPKGFGRFSDEFLVGNSGDGKINVFSRHGKWIGTLKNKDRCEIIINGLHGLSGSCNQDKVFFVAGPMNGENGLVGSIDN